MSTPQNTNQTPAAAPVPDCESKALNLDDETPLASTCDLSGDTPCEACQ